MGGGQPHPPSPPLPFDHLRVLGSVASSNSRRTWSWFPVGRGPWAKTGRKRQGRAAAGRGGGFKAPAGAAAPTGPTPGLALQGLGRGLRLAPRCLPTSLPRVPPTFPEVVRSFWRAGLAGGGPGGCVQTGKEPPQIRSPQASLHRKDSRREELEWGRAQRPMPPQAAPCGGPTQGTCPAPMCTHRQSPGDRGTNSFKSGNGGGVLATPAGCQQLGRKAARGQGHRVPGPVATGALWTTCAPPRKASSEREHSSLKQTTDFLTAPPPTTFQNFCTCCLGHPCKLPQLRLVPTAHPPTASEAGSSRLRAWSGSGLALCPPPGSAPPVLASTLSHTLAALPGTPWPQWEVSGTQPRAGEHGIQMT